MAKKFGKKKTKKEQIELLKITPKSFADAKEISKQLRNGNVLVVNFEALENKEILRIIDFISGSLYMVDGKHKKVSKKTYLLSPSEELLNEFSGQI